MTNSTLFSEEFHDPLITIAIPTFNRASLLGRCVAAALAQSYERLEVLVSDNASTDDTPQILQRMSDRRLRVVRQERNIGLLPNFNALLERATGKFIVFVPDDDKIAPSMLDRCVALVKQEPQIAIIVTLCDVNFVTEGRMWQAPINLRLGTGIWAGSDILQEFLKDKLSAAICSIMYRTDTLRAKGGFPLDLPYAADVASWVPLLLEGKAGFVNESCASLGSHSASQTSRFGIDVRVNDGRRIVELITSIVDNSIEDSQEREKIKLEAQRHFARRTVTMLAFYRKQGARFVDVLPLIWRWRQDFARLGLNDIVELARSLAILILPGPIVRWTRATLRSEAKPQVGKLR